MKKTKRILSLILIFTLLFSTIEMVRFSASTTNTKYSKKHLQNGNFEENSDDYKLKEEIYAQPNKTSVPYWDTTAYEGKFEFFISNTTYHFKRTKNDSNYGENYCKVADGRFAAELNADEESTIYQRIETVAGSTYTWGLDHRGRDTTDRMVLIIGPEQFNESGKSVDPSKPSKTGQDQFVRITNWLKTQYGVNYPEIGCSQKYTVYSKPFAASGKFQGESSDEDENISMIKTETINQEWSIWVISSPYCNTTADTTTESGIKQINSVNGWSAYGTNSINDFDDIMKGASSQLGYDCTYTVPKGQTNTLFAFCSFSSGKLSNNTIINDSTYGNLLDDINFELYQPISSSITPGGIGSADDENINITSDITSDKSMHHVVLDGNNCTVRTISNKNDVITNCNFIGAYVTINNNDGTPVTTFREIYDGDISTLTEKELAEIEKTHFIESPYTDADGNEWKYYTKVSVESPVSIHLVYTKAPFVLYDSNGGEEYHFSPDNEVGGNLVGFADDFITVVEKDENGNDITVDTSKYYYNYTTEKDKVTGETRIVPGFYKSHAALPNTNWETNDDGTSPHKFCGWSLLDKDGKQAVIDGTHTVTYTPDIGSGGMVLFGDSEGNPIENLLVDATYGITLTAIWKFVHRAQAQTYTYNDTAKKWEYVDSAVGGTVEETLIADALRADNVTNYTETVNGEDRIAKVDAMGSVGDKIMFKATPDYQNNYTFDGWYYREKQSDGTYKEVLRTTSPSIAVTVEKGKLNTYYARFRLKSLPVIFHYTSTGNPENYDYYDKSTDDKYGKYYQDVTYGETAVKPTGDSKSVTTWFTSPTERGAEFIFDFNTTITKQTDLYAGPSFAFNYFNYFKIKDPWYINTFGTIKVDGKYIDLKNNTDVTDYNVYMLKGTLEQLENNTTPLPSAIKADKNTIKIGKSASNDKLIYNTLTNTGNVFNRAGARFNNFYLFNMKTPVWVVFDFTYKGVKYTSTVKNRSLYNDITTYMQTKSKYYTDFPPEDQEEYREVQTNLLNSIQNMYNAVSSLGIEEPSVYADSVPVSKDLEYKPEMENPYTFTSTTGIRNIEPWGLKYSFTVDGNNISDFDDYGAVVMTDRAGDFSADSISVSDLLENEASVMYSMKNNNIYSNDTGETEVYYVNNMYASDLKKNTYTVFFVKDSDGNTYYSDVVSNNYNSIAAADTSDKANISQSIINYSTAIIDYHEFIQNNP